MFARFVRLALTPLLSLGVFVPLVAQDQAPITINRCTSEAERLLPPVDSQPALNSITSLPIQNKYHLKLAWERVPATSCHSNPPSPIIPGQDSMARWVYFWDLGDGTFSRDSIPTHTYPAGTHVVQTVLKPIYSDDDDPVGRITRTIVVNTVEETPTYPEIIPGDSIIALNVNWPASRPGGYVVCALTYPKIRQQGQPARTIYLAFPDNEFELALMQTGSEPTSSQTESYNGRAFKIYSWYIDQPEGTNIPSEENSIFVHLRVKDAVANLLPDTASSLLTSIMAMIKIESGIDKSENIWGTSKADGKTVTDPGVSSTIFQNGIDQMATQSIALNWASDPNQITVFPEVLEPGTTDALLRYNVGFFNGGTATAFRLRVDAHLKHALLDTASLVRQTPSLPFPQQTTLAAGSERIVRWATGNAQLPSIGQSHAVGFDSAYCFGNTPFTMKTKAGYALQAGDTIRAYAQIRMENSDVTTNAALVRVQALRHAVPCAFGLKFQYNLPYEDDLEHRSGFNLALTLRKPLCKIPNPGNQYFFTSRIPKSEYPVFWWQAELGYGQTNLRQPEVDSFQLGHLDVTPFMLRFIAKKPDLRFGSVGIKRGWGFSAGYTTSLMLHGKVNGETINWDGWDFGDRLDHSFSAAFDLLNLVGQPGLSFGFGWRWRNTAVTGERQWFQHPFTYIHYTFSHRLRYEL